MELQGKKVLVFGSGKSGIGASDLLGKIGAFPIIYDGNADIDKEAVLHKTEGTYRMEIYAGELPKEVQDSLDLVVLSPGVPVDLPIVKSFYEQGLLYGEKWSLLTVRVREKFWLSREPTERLQRQLFWAKLCQMQKILCLW